jgi:hypothetical protein
VTVNEPFGPNPERPVADFMETLKPASFENELEIVEVLPTEVVPVYCTELLGPGGA